MQGKCSPTTATLRGKQLEYMTVKKHNKNGHDDPYVALKVT